MDKESKDLWELRLSVLAPLITGFGIIVGLYTFEVGQRDAKVKETELLFCKDRIDFERQLWVKKLDIYMRLLEAVGKIAKSDKAGTSSALRDEFSSLYWGATLITDDKDVEVAMRRFRDEVDRANENWSNSMILKKRALELGVAIQHSVRANAVQGSISACK